MTTPSITSNELNYLVFRYLQESGFTHSAFALGYEAGINRSPVDGNLIPPGALVTFVQKGLQYIELEANLSNDGHDVDDDFSLLQPLDLITKDFHELRRIIKEKKESLERDQNKGKEKSKDSNRENEHELAYGKEKEVLEREKEKEEVRDKIEKGKEQENGKDKDKDKDKQQEQHTEKESAREHEDKIELKTEEHGISEGPEPMDITSSPPPSPVEVPSSDVTILGGHTSEVFACAWSPTGSLLASGSGDSTARIWTIPQGHCGSSTQNEPPNSSVLRHFRGRTNEKSKDVTTLDWNGEGTLLATGSYDGHARIWDREGDLKITLSKHKGPIFSLKWNKKGDFLLSGSVDKTAIVWDVRTGECKQQFEFHSAPTLDVDWRNNVSFASCSTDNMIYVCKVGETRPIKAFAGHQGEINAIKWDPTGSLLASCSDDMTAKIWSLKQDKFVHDFKDHQKEIYTIRWSPTGPAHATPISCASFDSTVKLWDVDAGRLLHSLNGHRQPVYSVAFSPNGEFLASGSVDQCLHVWSLKEGRIIKTFRGGGGIFEVCWNREGDKIAACFSDNTVCVVDFRK
ncbi:unnamed protein product [Spirodela intermedia]|uniref:Uncharacterized protein n=1 Tax=Spirodela intermedia TaxID=51605 RepID=A0A7I8JCZ1_SPIIN|nr:unnamed protein product [Spirodela intermedia]CAA6667393.1 unnamed protein product [Spirodela intermedia]